jgi:Circadian oscillating protein COP23
MMKTNGIRLFASVLSIASILAITSEQGFSQTRTTEKTTFHCIRNGTAYATVARRGNAQTGAMITWNDTSFGSKFTPKERCAIVGQRFNKALGKSGYSLSLLKLTHGVLRSNPVVCYIGNTTEKCNDNNLILTLNKSELGQERQIIEQLKNFSVSGTGTPLTRGRNDTTIAEFGKQINRAFKSGATQPATPDLDVTVSESTTPQPVSNPIR